MHAAQLINPLRDFIKRILALHNQVEKHHKNTVGTRVNYNTHISNKWQHLLIQGLQCAALCVPSQQAQNATRTKT